MTQWRKKTADETYSNEEVQARLAQELPQWYLEDGWIRRKIKTSGWKSTLMVVNTVGHLAEAAWHHPDLTVSYAFVTVKLMDGAGLMHGLRALQDRGQFIATLAELRSRAELVVCIGTSAVERFPLFFRRIGIGQPGSPCQRVVFLGSVPPAGM